MSDQTTAVVTAQSQNNAVSTANFHRYDPYQKVEIRKDFGKGDRSQNLVPQYLDAELMKTYTMMYLGIDEGYMVPDEETGELKTLDVACFVDEKENRFVNGGTDLVKTCKKLPPMVEIDFTWTGQKKTSNNRFKRLWDVKLINTFQK